MPERPSPPERDRSLPKGVRVKIEKAPLHRSLKMAALLAIAGLLERGGGHPHSVERLERGLKKQVRAEQQTAQDAALPKTSFDKPEYFVPVPGGEYDEVTRARQTQTLPNGETIFRDAGLSFYRVQPKDTIYSIKNRLAKYPEFAHVVREKERLKSFNIPPESLKADSWLPIPLEARDRQLSDEQFCVYALQGIQQMREHKRYGAQMKQLERSVDDRQLVATILAVAKQESGGKPLGQFELHRYEPKHDAYSYSLFHVLMKGPGLDARRNLNLSEGQLYHPAHATKLFLGFMIEKSLERRRSISEVLPLETKSEQFASFYNGTDWKTKNPHYVANLTRYYGEALNLLDEAERLAKQRAPVGGRPSVTS